jgi:hypothetical protein
MESRCILLLEPAFPERQALRREAGEILLCKGPRRAPHNSDIGQA